MLDILLFIAALLLGFIVGSVPVQLLWKVLALIGLAMLYIWWVQYSTNILSEKPHMLPWALAHLGFKTMLFFFTALLVAIATEKRG